MVRNTEKGAAKNAQMGLSYAKIRMKVKTFESRVFEMEYSSLKRRILTVSRRVVPGKVRALTNMSQSAQTLSSLLCNQLKICKRFQCTARSNSFSAKESGKFAALQYM
jgi:hypothetical protein